MIAALVAMAVAVLAALPAFAGAPVSGPTGTSAHIHSWYGNSLNHRPLRTGNTSYGLKHIQIGGSTRNTSNHETTPYATNLWTEALNEAPKANTSWPGGRLYTKEYTTPGGHKRTMCVVVDTNDLTYAGTNYGLKGIITAFWASGWDTAADACAKD